MAEQTSSPNRFMRFGDDSLKNHTLVFAVPQLGTRSYLKLVPTYENDNQPTDGDMSYEGIYMRAGESGDVSFLFKPSKTGNAVLKIYTSDDILLGEFDVIVSEIQEDITGINSITNQKKTTTDKYYNLNGQQVMHPEKGVFITNGRKIVKK